MNLKLINPEDEKPNLLVLWLRDFFIGSIFMYIFYLFNNIHNKGIGNVFLKSEELIVKTEDDITSFSISEIEELKIYFNTNNFIKDSGFIKYSKIVFYSNNKKYNFYYSNNKKSVKRILKHLYEFKIDFKEYYNEQRRFMLRKKSYKEIQEIKSEYGVTW